MHSTDAQLSKPLFDSPHADVPCYHCTITVLETHVLLHLRMLRRQCIQCNSASPATASHAALAEQQTPATVRAGMLFYGNKFWGITEANYLLVMLHSMTGYFGPDMWRADVAAMLGFKLPFTLLVNDCLLMFIAFFAMSYSLAAFYRVLNVDQVPVLAPALSTCFKATLLPDITDARMCLAVPTIRLYLLLTRVMQPVTA